MRHLSHLELLLWFCQLHLAPRARALALTPERDKAETPSEQGGTTPAGNCSAHWRALAALEPLPELQPVTADLPSWYFYFYHFILSQQH